MSKETAAIVFPDHVDVHGFLYVWYFDGSQYRYRCAFLMRWLRLLLAWLCAFPLVFVFAPLTRKIVAKLV